ncbi:Spore Coat Protein U domain protein [compost metagenome]
MKAQNLGLGLLTAAIATAIPLSQCMAATGTGTINATITLEQGCTVNSGNSSSTFGLIGTLDFGTQPTGFDTAETSLSGGGAANGFTINCTNGATANWQVTGGVNDGSGAQGTHAMTDSTYFVGYDVYTDAGRTTVLANSSPQSIVADGTPQAIPLYARAFGDDGLAAGTYADTLTVQVSW